MFKSFKQLHEEEMEVQDLSLLESRTSVSVKNRFQRHIQKDLQLHNACHKHYKDKNPSGWNLQQILEAAAEKFRDIHGRPFRFGNCVETLHKLPKFQPNYKDPDADEGSDNEGKKPSHNSIGKVMGHTVPRPMGQKKAKAAMKEDSVTVSSNHNSNWLLSIDQRSAVPYHWSTSWTWIGGDGKL